jgi:hypothetical protein
MVYRWDLRGQGDHMKPVEADLGMRQYICQGLGVGRAHVHADVPDLVRVAAVRDQVGLEFDDRAVLSSLGHKQQTLCLEVVDHGHIILATPETQVVNANHGHAIQSRHAE